MILIALIFTALAVSSTDALYLTPASSTVTKSVGESVLFTCTNNDASSSVLPTWTDTDGNEIRPQNGGGTADMHVVYYESTKATHLNIFNIIQNYEGAYGCFVGADSDTRRLIVYEELEFPMKCPTGANDPPCEKTHQDDQEIIIHEADRIECTVTGNPEPTVTWNFNGGGVVGPRYTFQKTVDGKEVTHILAISNVTRFDEGLYKCQAAQLEQATIKAFDITVDVQEPPKIILPPTDKNATEGDSAVFNCRAEGDPQPDYTWFRGGGDPLQNGEKYTLEDDNRQLTINNLVKEDLGSYTCQAENAAGTDLQSGYLNVFIPPLMNVPENETRDLNQEVEFQCYLRKGEPNSQIRWKRYINGVERWFTEGKQDFNERYEVFQRNIDSSEVTVLRITGITKEDEGPYTCYGKNEGGINEADHWLLVEYQPQVDLSRTPHKVKGWVDNESNMTCFWDAYPSPKVRWTKNRIPLKDGVNATIETEVVVGGVITILYVTPTSKDFGPYECHAENRIGKTVHNIEFEQVFPPDPPINIRQTAVSSTTFTIDVDEPLFNGGLRVEGYQVGFRIPGFPEDFQDFNETEPMKVLGLTPERDYMYRVACINDAGIGEFSDNKTVRTGDYRSPNVTVIPNITSAPDPPVILSKANDGRGNKYTLEWREADNNGGSQVNRFLLSYSQISNMDQTEPGLDQKEVTVAKGTIAYTITDLLPGKFYRILLYSENTFGVSEEADINIAMPGGIPLVPTTKYPQAPYDTMANLTSDPILLITESNLPTNKLPSISDKLTTPALIGVILGAFFFLLILVDISCYCMNNCGFLMCLCVHCCGKVPPEEKDDLELGDGPPGYGNNVDRGNGEMPEGVPLRHDSDDDSIVKPPMNGFSEGEPPEEVRGIDPFEVKLKALDDDYHSEWK